MVIVITSDVDFVSDDVLMEAYKGLEKIPMTIFQTHHSFFFLNIYVFVFCSYILTLKEIFVKSI